MRRLLRTARLLALLVPGFAVFAFVLNAGLAAKPAAKPLVVADRSLGEISLALAAR